MNGMKYHFVRCKKANPPEFNCELCGKKFQCRTGLVWHLKKTHKVCLCVCLRVRMLELSQLKDTPSKRTLPIIIGTLIPVFSLSTNSSRGQPYFQGHKHDGHNCFAFRHRLCMYVRTCIWHLPLSKLHI